MKRFAANKIYLSEAVYVSNAYLQVDSDGRVERIISLNDEQECHSTPFYNGMILPFAVEQVVVFRSKPLKEVIRALFQKQKISEGDPIDGLTLVYGKDVLVNPDDDAWKCRGLMF